MDISFRDLIDAEVAADWHLKALKAVENGLERGTIEVRTFYPIFPLFDLPT